MDEVIKLDSVKVDTLFYADDILVLNETKSGLQRQLRIIEDYGIEYDIKYNPDKTVFMVLNEEIRRSATLRREDVWQEDLVLWGINIQKISQMKYLGFEIDSRNKDNCHIQKRKQNANGSLAKLNLLGINSEYLSP